MIFGVDIPLLLLCVLAVLVVLYALQCKRENEDRGEDFLKALAKIDKLRSCRQIDLIQECVEEVMPSILEERKLSRELANQIHIRLFGMREP